MAKWQEGTIGAHVSAFCFPLTLLIYRHFYRMPGACKQVQVVVFACFSGLSRKRIGRPRTFFSSFGRSRYRACPTFVRPHLEQSELSYSNPKIFFSKFPAAITFFKVSFMKNEKRNLKLIFDSLSNLIPRLSIFRKCTF